MSKLINTFCLMLVDTLALLLALFLAHETRLLLEHTEAFRDYSGDMSRFYLSGLLFIFFIFINAFLGLYSRRNDFWEELRLSYSAALFLLLSIVMLLFIAKTTEEFSRTVYFLMFFYLLFLLPIGRVFCKKMLFKFGVWQLNAFVVGNKEQAQKLKKDLADKWYLGYRSVENIEEAEIVFIATRDIKIGKLEAQINNFKHKVKEVVLIPYLHSISFANADIIDLRLGRTSFINIKNQLFIRKNIVIKKIAELLLIVLLLPIIAVVLVLITLFIVIDSRGSVLFKQKRLGRDGEVFECYKFRTMHIESDEMLKIYLNDHPEELENYAKYHKYKEDPRLTSVGKFLRHFSLDELPQIFNILRLEMNLIGPRPYMENEKEKIGEALETVLHVRPGLTGLWQISGRNDLDFYERVDLDVWYIQNWSLWLDFIIFMKTFEVLFTRRGAR